MTPEARIVAHGALYLLIFGLFAGLAANFHLRQDYLFEVISLIGMAVNGYLAVNLLIYFQEYCTRNK